MMSRMAILGAGVAGSTAAQRLVQAGHQVTLFDKGRKPGGRCATRPMERGGFDYGAQFFTARDPRFLAVVQDLARNQWVTHWECRSGVLGKRAFHYIRPEVPRWVGTPGMSSLVLGLHTGLEVHFSVTVEALRGRPGEWWVMAQEMEWGPFEGVLTTFPAPQAAALVAPFASNLSGQLERVAYEPCLAALAQLKSPAGLSFDAAAVEEGEDGLGFVTRNNSKPHRAPFPEQWVIHSSVAWAQAHLEEAPEQSAQQLWASFCRRTGVSDQLLDSLKGHRWRFARVSQSLGQSHLWDASLGLGWAGDGAISPRLESAFISGLEAAEGIIRSHSSG